MEPTSFIVTVHPKPCLRSVSHPATLPLLPPGVNRGCIWIVISLIENTLHKLPEIQLIRNLVNVFLMNVVIEGPLVLPQRWEHPILRMRVGIRALWLLFDAGPREIRRPPRWLTQSSVINQGSILLLILGWLNSVLTHLVLHVALDDAVLESLGVDHGAVLHQLKVVSRYYDLCGR